MCWKGIDGCAWREQDVFAIENSLYTPANEYS